MAISIEKPQPKPLHVIVAGAGIGGLTAALALRRQGHIVDVYEQSRLLQEAGAAIHMAPNSYSQLKRLGLDSLEIGGNQLLRWKGINGSNGKEDIMFDYNMSMINPWVMIHRAQLHTGLKDLALSEEGDGQPVRLHTGSRVATVNTKTATLTFENGSSATGDMIIGADGVHSKTRKAITGDTLEPFDSGKTAFRMLIPRSILLEDPTTAPYVNDDGTMAIWSSDTCRVVMYSCMNNTMMNLAAIHPSKLSPAVQNTDDSGHDSWHIPASKANLLDIFSSMGPGVHAIFEKTDEKQLKLWRFLDLGKVPTFAQDKLALLGDAAHPFLPYMAQGGAQAIEDAMSLGAIFPMGTSPAEVPERLKLYNDCRYERASHIQEMTRLAGDDAAEVRGQGFDMIEGLKKNLIHDEWLHSSLALVGFMKKKALEKHRS